MFEIGLHIVVALIGGVIGCLFAVIAGKLSEDNMSTVRNWLWYAIFQAEMTYGGKTGEVKLQSVYNKFVMVFPKLAKKINFNTFSNLVDEILENVNTVINDNEAVQKILQEYQDFKNN